MKKTIFIISILLTFTLSSQAQKIAYVHRDSVIKMMPEMKKAQQEINNFLQQAQNEINQMQNEYQKKVQDFNSAQDTLSDLIKQNKIEDIKNLEKRIQEFQTNAQTEYINKQKELLIPIQKKFEDALEKVRKKGGYDVIINIEPDIVLYVNDKYIITDEVIKELGIVQ